MVKRLATAAALIGVVVPFTNGREVVLQAVVPWLHISTGSRGRNERRGDAGDWRLIKVLGIPVVVDLRVIDVFLLRCVRTRDVSKEKCGLD